VFNPNNHDNTKYKKPSRVNPSTKPQEKKPYFEEESKENLILNDTQCDQHLSFQEGSSREALDTNDKFAFEFTED
jgi:hypothetical protein